MDAEHVGAAKRRRERRLRQWHRHERMTVAVALAEATHHVAPRRPKTARAESYARRPTETEDTPSRGSGRASSRSPGRRGVTAACGTPRKLLLHCRRYADAAADTVDHSSLAFLLKVALQVKKDEEEEARKVEMEQVQAAKEEWHTRRKVLQDEFLALLDLESRSSLQKHRLQELLNALDAHDASKPSSGPGRWKRKKRRRKRREGRAHDVRVGAQLRRRGQGLRFRSPWFWWSTVVFGQGCCRARLCARRDAEHCGVSAVAVHRVPRQFLDKDLFRGSGRARRRHGQWRVLCWFGW